MASEFVLYARNSTAALPIWTHFQRGVIQR